MIQFRLDARTGLATYAQLVQQVRHALRTGVLGPGDRLPKVREVAEALAINPNTVLRAYRELEQEGLVEGRQGLGTFVLRSLAGPSLPSQAPLRRDLVRWLDRARTAGLDNDDITALVETTITSWLAKGVA